MNNKQNGNVLFLILIAVALFAALSYAVTNSTRSGGNNIGSEQALLDTTPLIQYATELENAVNKVMLVNNCAEDEISAYSPLWPSGASHYDNSRSPADKSCHIFDPAGGGVSWRFPTENVVPAVVQPQIGGTKSVFNIGIDSCTQTELLFIAAVTHDMCLQINEQFGITNTGGIPPQAVESVNYTVNNQKFGWHSGNAYGCGSAIGSGGSPDGAELIGHFTGCWQEDGTENYNFYHVLLAR